MFSLPKKNKNLKHMLMCENVLRNSLAASLWRIEFCSIIHVDFDVLIFITNVAGFEFFFYLTLIVI